MKKFIALGFLCLSCAQTWAETNNYGQLSIESRTFFNDAPFKQTGQNHGSGVSFSFEPTVEWLGNDAQVVFKPFARLHTRDSNREHFDLREAYFLKQHDDLDIKIGLGKEFWGVMESNHLIDIINQTDMLENVDGEDKLGQPMVRLNWNKSWGNSIVYILPYFRERRFSGDAGRFRPPVAINTDNPIFEDGLKSRHPDIAFRFAKTVGDWDLGISHFSGTSRDPQYIPSVVSGTAYITPSYGLIDQTSLDVQYTGEEWLLKLEAMTRSGQHKRFGAYSAGFEYTFYDVAETNIDLGTIVEYSQDNRSDLALNPTLFNNDIFFGARFGFNDMNDSQILLGNLIDIKSKFRAYTLEGRTRLTKNISAELTAQFAAGRGESVDIIGKSENYVQLNLSYYY